MFIHVQGFKDGDDEKWINADQILTVRYSRREKKFYLYMTNEVDLQVWELRGMAAIDRLLGAGSHEVGELYRGDG